MLTRSPPSQAVSRSASAVQRGSRGVGDRLEQVHQHRAGVVLHPAADDPAVHPRGGAGVAVAVEERRRVPAEVEVAALPAHHGGVEHRQQRGPRPAGRRPRRGRPEAASPRHRRRATPPRHPRRRAPPRWPSSWRPATTAGPRPCRGRSCAASAAPARRSPRGASADSGVSPSQVDIGVHRGRAVRQWPALRPRTIAASTASWASTRGATGNRPPYFLPGASSR